MKTLSSVLLALLLLAGASATAASPGPDAGVVSAIPDLSLDGISPLTPTEMAALTGSAPDWVQAGCAAVGGYTGSHAVVKQVAKQLGKKIVIGVLCPWCATAMTVAALGCVFIF